MNLDQEKSGANPQKRQSPTISLCMMVKNEEVQLPRLLSSTAPWVDEIIVVDTGSEDRTIQIAKEYGAKVYEHPWEWNFAKHRNQSISYATMDWVFILDADEELLPETAPSIKPLLAKVPEDVGAVYIELFNELPGDQGSWVLHPRLFRNEPGFRYEGLVHNEPKYKGGQAKLPIKLHHYGYNLDNETMEQKKARRVRMIREWLEKEPDHYAAHAYMAQALLNEPETRAEAVDWARKAINLADKKGFPPIDYPRAYYSLIAGLFGEGEEEEGIEKALACARLVPIYPDPYLFLSWVYYKRRDFQTCYDYSKKFVALQDDVPNHPNEFRYMENMTAGQVGQALARLVLSGLELGKSDEALAAFRRIIEVEQDEQGARMVLESGLVGNRHDINLEFNQIVKDSGRDWFWIEFFYQMAKSMANKPKAQKLKEKALAALEAGQAGEALADLESALELYELDPELYTLLGRAHLAAGDKAAAADWLARGANFRPGRTEAWRLLADLAFEQGEHQAALTYYQQHLEQNPGDENAASRVKSVARRLEAQPAKPSVAQSPPRMVVFLASGLTPQVLRKGGPHFVLNRAWGELMLPEEGPAPGGLSTWAGLYTGKDPAGFDLPERQDRANPVSLSDIKGTSLWAALATKHRVGLLAAPLTCPPPELNGWAVAGHPGGLMSRELVQPDAVLARVLVSGYRADFLLNRFEDQTFANNLANRREYEAQLYQVERNKVKTALGLPAVDVLVIGFSLLDIMHRASAANSDRVFGAYHQLYAMIEGLLAALDPESYLVLSEYGFDGKSNRPTGGGFYCLSWLKGQNAKAAAKDIAPEVLKRMGMDPGLLAG